MPQTHSFSFLRHKLQFAMAVRPMLKAAACATTAIAGVSYTYMAASGRVFPFAPVSMIEDPDGPLNDPNYKPILIIALFFQQPCSRQLYMSHRMLYLKEYSREHFKNPKHSKPLQLSVWPTAMDYYATRIWDTERDRRCLVVKARHIGEMYLETIVEKKLE